MQYIDAAYCYSCISWLVCLLDTVSQSVDFYSGLSGTTTASTTSWMMSVDDDCLNEKRLHWRNDGVAAASSDGGPTGGRGPPTVLEF